MPTQTVRLQVQPDMVEAFMNCFTLHSLDALKSAQDAGYQLMNSRDCFVNVVLAKPDCVSAEIDEEGIPVTRRAIEEPKTFKEFRSSSTWRSPLRLLARTGETIMVAEGEACMGSYQAVVLTGKGFQLECGASGMTATYSPRSPKHAPIRTMKHVLKMALSCSAPMSDDPPGTPAPTESQIVADLFRKIEELRERTKKPAKK